MNWLDAVIIVLMIISVFSGLVRGLIKSLIPLIGLIVGLLLALRYYQALADLMSFIPQETAAKIVAFFIILVPVIIIAALIARLVSWGVSSAMLGWLDHLLGAIFGLVVGAITYGTLLALWVRFFGEADVINHSVFATFLLDHFSFLLRFLPEQF